MTERYMMTDGSPPGRHRSRYLTRLDQVSGLTDDDRERLAAVSSRFAFRANDYYLSLIDWQDPGDPIRALVIPQASELDDDNELDPSREASYTPVPGLQHKYPDTALILVNETCGAYCRYCFRKRLFLNENEEAGRDLEPALAYLADHGQITNVLLTGGDPLILSTRRIAALLDRLREIDHLRIIRIGSKMPAFWPFRITEDPGLVEALRAHSRPDRRIYLMCHFDHPRELTDHAISAIDRLLGAGVVCVNQCPLIRGVNDDAGVLRELFERLSWIGCPQYYLFQCRPTAGNAAFALPLSESYRLFGNAVAGLAGLAKKPRLVMSHATGKVEVVGLDAERIYLRYHRAAAPADRHRFFACWRDDHAAWLDDLTPVPLAPRRTPPPVRQHPGRRPPRPEGDDCLTPSHRTA